MGQVERETEPQKQSPRGEVDASVSVLWSSWPGWIRTHVPDDDDLRRRERDGVLRPDPRPTSAEADPHGGT